jgi:chromosome partitioning protein
MRTIAVVNQKGGCGKTTVSINLASALAERQQRTLLVDMDPQSHCAVGLAVPEEQIEQSIYDVLISNSRNEPIRLSEILWQISDRLELAPASIDLSAFEQQMAGIAERECCLKKVVDKMKAEFDYVVVDCPPAIGLLTFNALRAATDVVVPVETGYFAMQGLSRQLETLSILCERCNHKISVKVLASMYDVRTRMAREILAELRNHFGDKMFKTVVNFNTKVKEAASLGQPINEYDPLSKGQMDFQALAEEVIRSEVKQQRHEIVNSLAAQLEAISTSADELLKTTVPVVPKPAIAKPAAAMLAVTAPVIKKQSVEKPAAARPAVTTPVIEKQIVEKPLVAEPAVTKPVMERPPIQEVKIPRPQTHPLANIDAKLSDYYGVNQVNDAVVFVTLYPHAESVQIAGDFNNWQPQKTPMQKVGSSGVWQTKLKLPAGKYRYRLVVDGQWQQDPYNEMTELNPFGGYNSVIKVK